MNTFELIKSVYYILSKRRRVQFLCILSVLIVSGILESLYISAVVPLVSGLEDPSNISNYLPKSFLRLIYSGDNTIIVPIIFFILFGLLVFSCSLFRILSTTLIFKYSAAVGTDASFLLFRSALTTSYEYYLNKKTNKLISNIVIDSGRISGAVTSILQIAAGFVLSLSVVLTLLSIDFWPSFSIIIAVSVSYLSFSKFLRINLRQNSDLVTQNTQAQIKLLQNSVGSIRDVIFSGNAHQYESLFLKQEILLRQGNAKNSIFGATPKFFIEFVGTFVLILFAFIHLISGSKADFLGLFGAIAIGAQRLLPVAQGSFSGWMDIRSNSSGISDFLTHLSELNLYADKPKEVSSANLNFFSALVFSNIFFSYPNRQTVFADVSFEIDKGDLVGVIGPSGSGKTTLIEILSGLITPNSGSFSIDGVNLYGTNPCIDKNLWRRKVALVPQDVFLFDSSVVSNIAFESDLHKIDHDLAHRVAIQAGLERDINNIDGFMDLNVGEGGSLLSGGQRQRLGIARALYKQRELLILDEATSALDEQTEKLILSTLKTQLSDITIIMITHRTSNLLYCDKIFNIANRQILIDWTQGFKS